MRSLAVLAVVALATCVAIVLTRDPEETTSVAAFIASVSVAAAALAAAWLSRRSSGRRRASRARLVAARRAVEVGGVVGALLLLRVVDGLSLVTALFVVAAFGAAEAVLVARPRTATR